MKDKDAGSLWDTLIAEPLTGAGNAGLIDRQRMAIVIDGLDEATKNGNNDILNLLAEHIETLPPWIGVLLTGRPEPELRAQLKRYDPISIACEDPANQADLRLYIENWLQQELKAGKLKAHEVEAITNTLLEKCEGNFLYLAQLRGEVSAEDLHQPANLPQGLESLYLSSFERRFPDHVSDADNATTRWNLWVKPLLGYILASPEPLPLDLARQLMGWNADKDGDDHQNKTLQSLGSLLKTTGKPVEPAHCTLAPFHKSARDWLNSELALDFRVYPKKALYKLTEATWQRYLASQEKNGYAWQVLPDLLHSLTDAQQDLLLGEPEFKTSQVLYRLAESMTPALRIIESYYTWMAQVRYSERLANAAPESAEYARDLSISYDKLGDSLRSLGRVDEALGFYERGLKIREGLAQRAPESAEYARDLSISYDKLGDSLRSLGRVDEALGFYECGLKIREGLAQRAPESAEYARDLSVSYINLFRIAADSDKAPLLRKALAVMQSLKSRGVLAKEDESVMVQIKNMLGIT